MSTSRILLLDSDAERAAQVHAILGFVDYSPLVHDLDEQAVPDEQPRAFLAVIIGQLDETQCSAVCEWLRKDPQHAPLLLLPPWHGETLGFDPADVWSLDYPIRAPQLTEILRRISVKQLDAMVEPQAVGPTGNTLAIRRVRKMIQQVSTFDTTVLVTGESGTGKEVVARAIHDSSGRRDKPFVAVNCGAIPSELLESELFGHEKGAFTGAICARQGRFELAEGGTLFLDEIGDMSLPMQVKILRVLQERTFERVGSNVSRQCDVRIVAATHRNLESRIDEGLFREDLLYRLNVFPIELPALRDRLEDLPLLISEISDELREFGRGDVRFSPESIHLLRSYAWPGNVRELANLVERLAVLHPNSTIAPQDLPERYQPAGARKPLVDDDDLLDAVATAVPQPLSQLPEAGLDLKSHIADIEQTLIRQALEQTGGVVSQAAQLLNLRRTTLVEKLRKYDLNRQQASS
ncbi:Two-component system regulatory protein [Oceanococcus atlanticus]|uniref:Two-component system regulatory protein n=1 Tax=Oceanococcus atlanticus TaxID=1317117 RepID=A0A1Y1SGX1_9GAMM|nr:sigma-54-dependent Fis family transcriptional regulator [Oceanococcus atlanticus]ORE88640.1 Two-component system regulatory protein [Oceanococcus atlanticus]